VFTFSFDLADRAITANQIASLLNAEDKEFIKTQYEKNLIINPSIKDYLW